MIAFFHKNYIHTMYKYIYIVKKTLVSSVDTVLSWFTGSNETHHVYFGGQAFKNIFAIWKQMKLVLQIYDNSTKSNLPSLSTIKTQGSTSKTRANLPKIAEEGMRITLLLMAFRANSSVLRFMLTIWLIKVSWPTVPRMELKH